MKPIVSTILRGFGGLALGIVEAIIARREAKRQLTSREILEASPPVAPSARVRAQEAMRRREEAERRNRETGLPEVDEKVREMLKEVKR